MFWLVSVLVACGPSLPAPVLAEVSPNRGWRGDDTLVRIEGTDFLPQIVVNANRVQSVDLDQDFSAWLALPDGTTRRQLTAVNALSTETLQGLVPSGLDVGLYDLWVQGPSGERDVLGGAFEVTADQVDRLSLEATDVVVPVGDLAYVRLNLLDPAGNPVVGDSDFDVTLTVTGEDLSSLRWVPNGLDGQVVGDSGNVLTGTVKGGRALVGFSLDSPQNVTVSVRPASGESRVLPDQASIRFESGEIAVTEINLPTPDFVVDAGQPFDVEVLLRDALGNVVFEPREVILGSVCGGPLRRVSTAGPTVTEVTLLQASGTSSCAFAQFQSVSPTGASALFTVRPGPVDSLRVLLAPGGAVAGTPFQVAITALDAYGNGASLAAAPELTLQGGALSVFNCAATSSSAYACTARTTQAMEGAVVHATLGAVSGSSNPFDIAPSANVTVAVPASPGEVEAGTLALLSVHVEDEFGNAVTGGQLGANVLALADEVGDASCVAVPTTGDPGFDCVFSVARPAAKVTATLSGVPAASSAPFEVVNGPLSAVLVQPEAMSVSAGAPLAVELRGVDAFGNPYLRQSDALLDLTDTLGSVSPSSATLGADGTLDLDVSFTVAGATVLSASQGQVLLGESPPIAVYAALPDHLEVTSAQPFAFVSEALSVTVRALDAFGNVAALSGTGTVRALSASGPDVSLQLAGGQGATTWVPSARVDGETLRAEVGGLSGEVELFGVAGRCSQGPTVSFAAAGATGGRVCLNAGSATVGLSGAGSTGVARWVVLVDRELAVAGTQLSSVVVGRPGAHLVQVLGLNAALCGQDATATVWAGLPDGSPTGGVVINTSGGEVLPGGTLQLGLSEVRDCHGQLVGSGEIGVRVSRGALTPVRATGSGLFSGIVQGQGTVDWTVGSDEGGPARVVAYSAQAFSEAALSVLGDATAPVVLAQRPAGPVAVAQGEVELEFSEAVSFDAVSVMVQGDQAAVVGAPADLGEGRRWAIPFGPSLGGSAELVVLSVDGVSDLSGNPLDGDYTGSDSPWEGAFGGVAVPASTSCAAPQPRAFTPDGDPGLGAQADQVEVPVSAVTAPVRWRYEARSAESGGLVWLRVVSVVDAQGTLRWDGRDLSGEIVRAGRYRLLAMGEDGFGGVGPACEVSVELRLVEGP